MEKITVKVPQDIMALIPFYIESRHRDVEKIETALQTADFDSIATAGHMMRGSGRGYGFEVISLLGAALEDAAEQKDSLTIKTKLAELIRYLQCLNIEAA